MELLLVLIAIAWSVWASRRRALRIKQAARGVQAGRQGAGHGPWIVIASVAGISWAATVAVGRSPWAPDPMSAAGGWLALGGGISVLLLLLALIQIVASQRDRDAPAMVGHYLSTPGARAALLRQQHAPPAGTLAKPPAVSGDRVLQASWVAIVTGIVVDSYGRTIDDHSWQSAVGVMLTLVGVGGAVVGGRLRRSQRIQVWRLWAEAQGWSYRGDRKGKAPPNATRTEFPPTLEGFVSHHLVVGNVEGVRFATWNARPVGVHPRQYHVVAVAMPCRAPRLTIAMNTARRQTSDLGRAIDYESAAFSSRFRVRCSDRRFAYDVLHPRVLELVAGLGPRVTWTWDGDALLVKRPGPVGPDDGLDLLPAAMAFRDLVPRHVVEPVQS